MKLASVQIIDYYCVWNTKKIFKTISHFHLIIFYYTLQAKRFTETDFIQKVENFKVTIFDFFDKAIKKMHKIKVVVFKNRHQCYLTN